MNYLKLKVRSDVNPPGDCDVDECADGVTAGQKARSALCDKAVMLPEFTERKTKRKTCSSSGHVEAIRTSLMAGVACWARRANSSGSDPRPL